MRECKETKNLQNCNCSYEPCTRKGICCECLSYHWRMSQLPACLFPEGVLGAGGSILEFNLEPTGRTRSGLGPAGALVQGPVGLTLPLFLEYVKR